MAPHFQHVVLASFRDEALDSAVLAALQVDLQALVAELPGLLRLSCGPALATRGEHSFNWALMCTFTDRAAADAYQTHPKHVLVRDRIVSFLRGPPVSHLYVVDWQDTGVAQATASAVSSALESAGIAVVTALVVTRLLLRSSL